MGSVARGAKRLFALVVGMAAVEIVSYLALGRYATGLDGMPTVVMEEFPGIDRDLLEKFTSFDPELGWCPQPSMEKRKDTGDHLPGEEVESVVTYSTDEYGSRVCPAADRDPDAALSISTYGDSYCFCREVDDDETFQHYLAEKLDTHVGNYGAGNYGLDQALIRLKRRYPDDPTEYVVMDVTAASIARILSVRKHYQEFGNVLAVKPRYVLSNGSLEPIETPIEERTDLLDIEAHAPFFREHDYHYDEWFLPRLAGFPYAFDLLSDPDHVRYAAYSALGELEGRYGSIPGLDVADRRNRTAMRLERSRVAYHEALFEEYADLFAELVGEFVSYADREGFTPVFAMVGQLRYANYELEHGPVYGDLLDRLDERYPDLMTIDMANRLVESEDVESLYVQRGEGGHYSPETNERIAEILLEEVFERTEN